MNRIVILLALGVAAICGGTVVALSQKAQVAAQSVPATPAPAIRSQPAAVAPTPSIAAAFPPPSVVPSAQTLIISTCNGFPAHANFRAYPSFSPRSILGVVAIRESVNLTGRSTRVDGERWYEVGNPFPLHPTLDVGAQNRTAANQVGWIAECFVTR